MRARYAVVLGGVLIGIALVVAAVRRGDAWNTDDSRHWQSLYIDGRLDGHAPNEHSYISLLAVQQLGLERQLGNTGTAHISVVDLNASLFLPRLRRLPTRGDDPATALEERAIPTPMHFAGLPDYSYTMYDWANKNAICPVLPEAVHNRENCHVFAGWMGAFNANHFGSQATAMYKRYHAIALRLARRAARARLNAASGDPQELAFHDSAFREMEIEALAFENIGQHYLQDRWAMGHMWERWNATDYSRMRPSFGMNFLVGAMSGLVHGSEGVTGSPAATAQEYVGLRPWLQRLVQDPLSSPAKRPDPFNPAGIEPSHWSDASGLAQPQGGVGDYRLEDMLAGSYAGFPLDVRAQQQRMVDCSAAGVAEVIRALGRASSGGFGAHAFPLSDRTPVLGDHCWDVWATDDAIEKAMFSDDWITWAVTDKADDWRLSDLVNAGPDLSVMNSEIPLDDLYRVYRINVARIAARVRLQMIRNARSPGGVRSTALARGGLGSLRLGGPSVTRPGNAYGIASWVEPEDLDVLPAVDAATGGDRRTLYGFFSRSHLDYWARDADTTLAPLRGSKDPAKRAACIFLASHMYRGTPAAYRGAQREFRSSNGEASGRPLRSLAELLGVEERDDRDGVPIDIAPGYVGGSERGPQRPFATEKGAPQTVINWCDAVPVIHLIRDASGAMSAEDLVGHGLAGSELTLTGLRFGKRTGEVALVHGETQPRRATIVRWQDEEIRLRLPSGEFTTGDYRVRVVTSDGKESVGRFVLRVLDREAAARLATWTAAGDSAERADVCTIKYADRIQQAVDSATYADDLQQMERKLGWARDAAARANARVTAARDSLARLIALRTRLQQRVEVASAAATDADAKFRQRERRLIGHIQTTRQAIQYLEARLDTDREAIVLRDRSARDLDAMEAELARRRAAWATDQGASKAFELGVIKQSIKENRQALEELRWEIERAKTELTLALEQARRLDAEMADEEAAIERFKGGSAAALRRVPPPWVTRIEGRGYEAFWVTEESEVERYDRAIALSERLISDQRHLIRGIEADIQQAEAALLDSEQRWQYLWQRYAGRVQWEARASIMLELADSYENIFGAKSPAGAARANPLAIAGAAVVEAAFRIADARWGEPPSFDDPKLPGKFIEMRQRMAGNPAAEAAAKYGLSPTAHLWVDGQAQPGQASATSMRLDGQPYPTYGARVAGELSKPKEHLKSQLQSAIEVWSESPLRGELARGQYWSRMRLGARGLREGLSPNDPMLQAASMFYAAAGHQQELAGAGLRRMFSGDVMKAELRRLSADAFKSVGKDVVKTAFKEGVKELVQEGKLDAYLDAFGEELAYFAFRREYSFRSAQRQREVLDLALLREIRADLIAERDRVLPGRLLQLERSEIFGPGQHELTLSFNEPVEEIVVEIANATVDSVVPSDDGRRARVKFSFAFDAAPPALYAPISVQGQAPRTRKVLDGDPHTIACYSADEGWRRYEIRPDSSHRLRLAPLKDGVSIVFIVDASGSMDSSFSSGPKQLDAAKEVVRRWFSSHELPPNSEFSLWAIVGGAPARLSEFTTDTSKIVSALGTLAADGRTPLATTVDSAGFYLLAYGSNKRRAMIILSDGEDSEGGDYTRSIERLRDRAVAIRRESW